MPRAPSRRTRQRTATRPLTALLAGVVAAVGLAGCGGPGPDARSGARPATTSTTAATSGPAAVHRIGTFSVGRRDLTLVDHTRSTAAHGDQPELPQRTLPTLVLYPATAPPRSGATAKPERGLPAAGGRAPLVVFGHGSTRSGPDYLATLTAWASAGYVVAAPDFPLSKTGAPGGTDYGGIAPQTGDVSFVIDEVLARSADPDDPLAGTVDPEHIGIGGQSFGAITAIATAYNACCADPRIDALTEFAGMWFDLGRGDAVASSGGDVPGLFVHSDGDGVVPVAGDRKAARLAADAGAPVQLLTLVGGDHDAGFFRAGSNVPWTRPSPWPPSRSTTST